MWKTASLTPLQKEVILNQATEQPFSSILTDKKGEGSYLCRNCGLALFRGDAKFSTSCGWPSFDIEVSGAVNSFPDKDGHRTEIVCARCNAHLGHVFYGENFTSLNTRHCVNSVALDFVDNKEVEDSEEIILAAGCFWGVEYYLQKLPEVLLTEVGYLGGELEYPRYQDVCTKLTGHLEVVRVIFDRAKLSLEKLLKYFFEIHDFTQINGQGPDIGSQYLSAIFYYNKEQQKVALDLIKQLQDMSYLVATKVRPMDIFWPAEEYHHNYYNNKGSLPYCHSYTQLF